MKLVRALRILNRLCVRHYSDGQAHKILDTAREQVLRELMQDPGALYLALLSIGDPCPDYWQTTDTAFLTGHIPYWKEP